MKILILTVIFLCFGAWLVQEQEPFLAREIKNPFKKNQPHLQVASDIPKAIEWSQTQHETTPYIAQIPGEVESVRFEPIWDGVMYELLTAYDPAQGEEIFSNYVEERSRHEERVNQSITMSFDMLSDLNGQSGYGKQELDKQVVDLEREHSVRVKNILGDHFEYLDQQHQQFREPSVSEETGDLSR